ncbi:hypothetical protein [Sphingomonas sp. PvP055]|uniref:hypothetical protein n=1 Tax=Sphingomonas sp. PvP055 TaxID=3156391 RepID=UPI00339A2E7A
MAMIVTPPFFADASMPRSGDSCVTSSILVRHFGLWGQRAAKSPVAILQHGRPRLMLASCDHWNALVAKAAETASVGAIAAVEVLDAISDLVIGANSKAVVTETSRTARTHFGRIVEPGALLETITPEANRAMLHDAIRNVLASGTEAMLVLPSAARAGRTIRWLIVPQRYGIALIGRNDPAIDPSSIGNTETDDLVCPDTRT